MKPGQITHYQDMTVLEFPQEEYRGYRIVQFEAQNFSVYHMSNIRQRVWEAHTEADCKKWIDSQVDRLSANKLARSFLEVASRPVAYDAEAKEQFHRRGKALLKQIACDLGYAKGSFDLRNNKAGIAVSGEVTLHTDDLYVQLAQGSCGSDLQILYRSCKHRRDYTGGSNNWMSFAHLRNYEAVLERLKNAKRKAD
ncbi:MAG: hypothetical protein K2Q12_05995 [Rickettsiales bacterium]|nr:hypothetical protein [Rickettsiales bacterium]